VTSTPRFVSNDKIISGDPLSQWRKLVKNTQFFVNYADHSNSALETFIKEEKQEKLLGLRSFVSRLNKYNDDRQDDLSQVPSLKVFDTVKLDM